MVSLYSCHHNLQFGILFVRFICVTENANISDWVGAQMGGSISTRPRPNFIELSSFKSFFYIFGRKYNAWKMCKISYKISGTDCASHLGSAIRKPHGWFLVCNL
jgi:hypothetical protein